jgi:RNA-binding protein YhbY
VQEARTIANSKKEAVLNLFPSISVGEAVISDELINDITEYIESEHEDIEVTNLSNDEEIYFYKFLDKKVTKKIMDLLEPPKAFEEK